MLNPKTDTNTIKTAVDWAVFDVTPKGTRRLRINTGKFMAYAMHNTNILYSPDLILGSGVLAYDPIRGIWTRPTDLKSVVDQWVEQLLYSLGLFNDTTLTLRNRLTRLVINGISLKTETMELLDDPLAYNSPRYVTFKNGMLDLETGVLQDYDSTKFVSLYMPWDYHVEPVTLLDVPNTMKFLRSFVPAGDLIWFVQFIGSIAYAKAGNGHDIVLLTGRDANRREIVDTWLTSLFTKQNVTRVGFNTFSNNGSLPMTIDLLNKPLSIRHDVGGDIVDQDSFTIRQLVSGGLITARFKNNRHITFPNRAKFIINTERLFASTNTITKDFANMGCRLHVFDFPTERRMPATDYPVQPDSLIGSVYGERALFVSFAIQLYMEVLNGKEKMTVAKHIQKVTDDRTVKVLAITQFLEECATIDPDSIIDVGRFKFTLSTKCDGESTRNLFYVYKEWAYAHKLNRLTYTEFTKMVILAVEQSYGIITDVVSSSVLHNEKHETSHRRVIAGVFLNNDWLDSHPHTADFIRK